MKKLVIIFGLILISFFSSEILAQQDSLLDVFHLEVGKQYYYDFNLKTVYVLAHSSTRDTGIVNYRIISNSIYADSTVWLFKQNRSFTRYIYFGLNTTVTFIQDSSYFLIVEKHLGMHELYTPIFDGYGLFPFFKNVPESEKFYRYIDTTAIQQINLSLLFNPDPVYTFYTYRVNYLLVMDTGIVNSSARLQGDIDFYYTTAYNLKQTFTDIYENQNDPLVRYNLSQNYPNPFNPSTKISWQAPVSGWQTLKVYDVLGNEVATLVNEYRPAGSYEVEFKSTVSSHQLADGVYFYQLKAGDYVETKKMIFLK